MSQLNWDYLEENKQKIIEGELVYSLWSFEDLKGINDTLTKKEMLDILNDFDRDGGCYFEVAYEMLDQLVEDIISEREKTTV